MSTNSMYPPGVKFLKNGCLSFLDILPLELSSAKQIDILKRLVEKLGPIGNRPRHHPTVDKIKFLRKDPLLF